MTDTDTFKEGYATYAGLPNYSYNCITYLIDNNDLIWKLLKYSGPDAWNESNLTHAEKAALIYNSQPDSSAFRVFMDSGNPDVLTKEMAQLRIYPVKIFAENRTQGAVMMAFEVFSHYKINQLSNYQTRVDLLTSEILGVFNGVNIGGVGRLHFNGLETSEDRTLTVGQLPCKGKCVYMSNKDI